MAHRARRAPTSSRAFPLVAVGIVAFLLLSSLVLLIPIGSDGDEESNVDDDVILVTPGAEVARLETRVAGDPFDADSMVILAEMLANSGRVAESIPWFERAIEQRPDDASLRLAFGRALQRSGNDFDAEVQLKRAVELDQTDPAMPFYLGLLYESREPADLDAARRWYEASIETSPDSVIADQARDRLAALDGTATPTGTP